MEIEKETFMSAVFLVIDPGGLKERKSTYGNFNLLSHAFLPTKVKGNALFTFRGLTLITFAVRYSKFVHSENVQWWHRSVIIRFVPTVIFYKRN